MNHTSLLSTAAASSRGYLGHSSRHTQVPLSQRLVISLLVAAFFANYNFS